MQQATRSAEWIEVESSVGCGRSSDAGSSRRSVRTGSVSLCYLCGTTCLGSLNGNFASDRESRIPRSSCFRPTDTPSSFFLLVADFARLIRSSHSTYSPSSFSRAGLLRTGSLPFYVVRRGDFSSFIFLLLFFFFS